MEHFLRSSHFSGGNAAYIEDLYDTYLHDRNGVPEEWSSFFDYAAAHQWQCRPDISHATIVQHFRTCLAAVRRAQPLHLVPVVFTSSTSASRLRLFS